LAAAAAIVACLIAVFMVPLPRRLEPVSLSGGRGRHAGQASGSALLQTSRPADSRVLSAALADATAATWDLARTTSEPASRLGRRMLESAAQLERPVRAGTSDTDLTLSLYSGLDSLAALLAGVPEPSQGSALIQQMGNGLSASFRPLSSSARQAFGFLRIPSLEKIDNGRIHQPVSKGA
jgi:hypothetical protein